MAISGGLFLGWLGLQTMLSPPIDEKPAPIKSTSPLGAFASAFFLTLTNPMTILAYVAIFSSAAIPIDHPGHSAAFIMTGAIFVGSLLWWIILVGLVSATKHKMQPKHMRAVNTCSGLLLLGFGLYAAISALL